MVYNPERKYLGGDVEGTRKIAVTQGTPIEVSEASFDPGYGDNELENTLAAGYVTKEDLTQGFCHYGTAIGEK